MHKRKTIKIPIYFGYLNMILTDDFQAISDKYGFDMDMSGYEAITFVNEHRGVSHFMVVFKPYTSLKTICHETVHLVNRIMKSRGIELSYLNDEPQAYLSGWVFDQCYKFLNKELNNDAKV